MSSSREDSPDWLRSFQAPTLSAVTLSSDSNSHSSPNITPSRDHTHSPQSLSPKISNPNVDEVVVVVQPNSSKRKRTKTQGDENDSQVDKETAHHSLWTLSSDSESSPDNSTKVKKRKSQVVGKEMDDDADVVGFGGDSSLKDSKKKSPKKSQKVDGQTPKKDKRKHDDVESVEEDTSEKQIGPQVSTSRLPLVLSEKVQRTKALVECEGESIDLSGDVGAVGRIVISDTPSGNSEMFLDLKGTIYRTTIVPSRTFCIVSFGQSEAKIEAMMNDFIQLKPQSNVYEAETMVEGTLEGFSFDSEDEGDKIPKADQNEGNEEHINGKTKGKAEKSSGAVRKKGKTGGGRPQPAKKVRKKTQVSKKAKTKK